LPLGFFDRVHAIPFIRKRLGLLLAAAIVPAIAVAILTSRMQPVYEASTTVLVHPGRSGATDPGYYVTIDQMARTISRLMTRRPLLGQVIRDLSLEVTPAQLSQRVSVVPDPNSEIIAVKVRDSDPELAARIANKLVVVYVEQSNSEQEAQFGTALQSIQARINELNRQLAQTQSQIAELQSRSRLTPDQQGQLGTLQTKQAADSAAYSTLVRNYDEIRTNQVSRVGTVTQVEPAIPPTKPIYPQVLLSALTAMAVGVLAGVGLALLLNYLDNTLKSEEDVRSALDLPTLGVIPFSEGVGLPSSELIALTAPMSPIVEAYRGIRTNLLFAAVDEAIRTLVITSSLPEEGKSRTAANLAVVVAQAGRRVILVDADFRRPKLHELFGRIDTRGVTNLLIGEGLPADLLCSTDVPNLRLVYTGPLPLNPSEIMGSRRMHQLVEYLRESSDLVVFDTPPLNAVTDPAILASRVDGTLLVVHAGRTSRTMVRQAADSLRKVGARIVGVVLNKVEDRQQVRYSHYYESSAPQRHSRSAGGNALSDATDRSATADKTTVPTAP
jgi:non-specific protein-tyrosine kinase